MHPSRILISVLFLLAIGCNKQRDMPPKPFKSSGVKTNNLSSLIPPKIKLKQVSENQISTGYTHLIFEVENSNDFPLSYRGYMQTSFSPPLQDGEISPHYTVEFERNGDWKTEPIGWCGMGLGPVELPPNDTVIFDYPVPDDDWDSFKIAIDWSNASGTSQKAWSKPVNRTQINQ